MNTPMNNRILCTINAVSRRTSSALSRHAHTISSSQPLRPHGRPVSTPHSSPHTPRAQPPRAARQSHTCKTRSYTTQTDSPFGTDDRPFNALQEVGGRAVSRPSGQVGTQYVEKYLSGRHRNGQDDGGGGIIITTNRHTMRDKQGRSWTTTASDASRASQGAGAGVPDAGLGISVKVSAPPGPKTRRKPRIELRDLTVKPKTRKLEPWQAQKAALGQKFGDEGWSPRKKLSPDAMDGIRALHEQDPELWATPVLAEHFKISAEAIRRILKSKWKPKDDEQVQKRKERWARRYDRIWDHQAELGLRPQREKDREVEDPDAFDEEMRAKEMLHNARRA